VLASKVLFLKILLKLPVLLLECYKILKFLGGVYVKKIPNIVLTLQKKLKRLNYIYLMNEYSNI